ncbi:MAG: hypothetical protein AB7N76_04195 [Planctomycetota bacterium]
MGEDSERRPRGGRCLQLFGVVALAAVLGLGSLVYVSWIRPNQLTIDRGRELTRIAAQALQDSRSGLTAPRLAGPVRAELQITSDPPWEPDLTASASFDADPDPKGNGVLVRGSSYLPGLMSPRGGAEFLALTPPPSDPSLTIEVEREGVELDLGGGVKRACRYRRARRGTVVTESWTPTGTPFPIEIVWSDGARTLTFKAEGSGR